MMRCLEESEIGEMREPGVETLHLDNKNYINKYFSFNNCKEIV